MLNGTLKIRFLLILVFFHFSPGHFYIPNLQNNRKLSQSSVPPKKAENPQSKKSVRNISNNASKFI